MVDLDDPQQVAAELRRRGIPVHRNGELLGSDERLREVFTSARIGGWKPDRAPRARHINRGRLIAAQHAE